MGWAVGSDLNAAELESSPLTASSQSSASTVFVRLPAEQTGLVTDNHYADPRMWKEKFQEFKFGAMGTGVAVGDYDGDGRADVFVVSKTEQSRLFRNVGGWKFEDVTAKAGIEEPGKPAAWSQGAAFADVNNDGKLDLYLCRFGAPNLLFINQGDGTFREEAKARGLAVVDASGQGAFCDYDRDGWLDVYVQTNVLDAVKAPAGQRDYLFRNRGDGTFENATERAGIRGETQGHSVVWWDQNEDGWPDLYVANDFAPADSLYRNNRDGTFTDVLDQILPYTPHSSMGSDLGDVNNDGQVDLLVADMAATTHEKDQRGMAKIRAMLDTAVETPGVAPQLMRSALYLGTGAGRMREAAQLAGVAATDWTWSVRFEDFDNDGRLDLHVTNGMVRELHNADLVRDISASDSLEEGVRMEQASPPLAERNLAFRNEGGLNFTEVGRVWGLDEEGVSFGAATGDFDGDGDLDLVHANYQRGVTVLRNDSTGHRVLVALRGSVSNRFGVGAVVRIESALGKQMRTLVVARGYLSSSEPVLHFGLGNDPEIERLSVEWPSGHRQTFAQLPVDRKFTITEPTGPVAPDTPPAPVSQFVSSVLDLQAREQPEQEHAAQAFLPAHFDRRGPALAIGDLTRDGREEILLGGTTAAALQAPPLNLMVDKLDDGPLLVFEADGDGRPDLLQTKAGTSRPMGADYQPRLHLNQATGFVAAQLPPVPLSAGAAGAADFDRDGDLDVFLGARVEPGRYPLPARSVLLRNSAGRFEDISSLLPSSGSLGLVTSALWSDVDQDGWPDLILALEWGNVTYLHNDQGKGFTDYTERAGLAAPGTGWWTSLATADFNRDGKPDYAVGNTGLNTPYRASAAEPALLFYGRFGDGGPPQLIEAYYENGKLYPRRSRNELASKVTGLLRRYARNNDYAKATLPEILGEARLARAQRFAATEVQSGVFLSQSDGTYRFAALPRIAQIAPIQGLVAADFNGDGLADLCAVQNSHAPALSIGRFAGGLGQLLLGDGRGGFTASAPEQSGFVVPGDAKALVVADLNEDGWPDLVASRNDEPALAFRHRGRAGYDSFRVLLQGSPGNPTAIGARLTLTLADGSTQRAEVAAGSGYLSQSSPACFFSYSTGSPPRQLTIRWPEGSEVQHTFTGPPPSTLRLTRDSGP
jgi:hypothetical protein